MVRHQLRFAQADFGISPYDRFRIGAGDRIKAIRDGADLDAADLRIYHLRAKRPAEWQGHQRDLSQVSSCIFHALPLRPSWALSRRAAYGSPASLSIDSNLPEDAIGRNAAGRPPPKP